MPNFDLPAPLYARFQRLAIPLEDTPLTLFTRMLEVYERHLQRNEHWEAPRHVPPAESSARTFDAMSPPSLTHTKVLAIKVDGAVFDERSWNGLLVEMIKRA